MKLRRSHCGLGVALLWGVAVGACAPMPAPPGGAFPGAAGAAGGAATPGAGFPPAAGAPAPAAPAPPRNIYSFLCPTPEQKAACLAKICNSPIGQMLNNSLKPAGALTGGLVGPFCPQVTADLLNQPPESAAGTAAKIKADEAAAKQRVAAVRYLGTVDCNYWPDAQVALIASLRADRNECVRLEAALALGRGCCCNRATIKALALTVEGGNEDGNPRESSERVKAAAHAALEHCLSAYSEVETVPPAPEPPGPEPRLQPVPQPPPGTQTSVRPASAPITRDGLDRPPVTPAAFYRHVQQLSEREVAAQARRAAEKSSFAVGYPSHDHSVLGILKVALGPESPEPPGPGEPPPPTPAPTVAPGVPVYPEPPPQGTSPLLSRLVWRFTPRKMPAEESDDTPRPNILSLLRRRRASCEPSSAPETPPPAASRVGAAPSGLSFPLALRTRLLRRGAAWGLPASFACVPELSYPETTIRLDPVSSAPSGDVLSPASAPAPQ
jgi:hypothetical protein